MPSSHAFWPQHVGCMLARNIMLSSGDTEAEGWEPCRRQRPAEDWPGPPATSLGHIEVPRFLPILESRTLAPG